jgi:cytochrome oxidase Cu insertion factor (SCO1/SenC/PrrC family)
MFEKMRSGKKEKGRTAVEIFCSLIALYIICLALSIMPVQGAQTRKQAVQKKAVYVCVMDREIRSSKPGKCPKCGMALRIATSEPDAAAPVESVKQASPNGDLVKSAQIPDTVVYDQDGKKLRFYTDLVKGKTVAINFIFTTCATICPPLTATFRRVQQELGDHVGRDIQMISISVDPTTDVPERLKEFSTKFKAGPGWAFITGNKQEINQLLKALGANVGDKTNHSPMALVGNDSADYWTRTYGLAPVATLVKVIQDASQKTAAEDTAQVPLPDASAKEKHVERRVANDATAQPGAEPKKARTPAEAAAAYFTNTVLLTQDNKPVRFFDDMLKGNIVIINFMFSTCAGVCPAMTSNLKKVQDYLGDRVGRDINMISISVDPTVDTPEALKKYVENYKVKPGWHFLTGKKEDVDFVLRKVGGFAREKNEHTTLLMIGNVETGVWMKLFAMSKPAEIADAVIKLTQENQ